MAASQIGRCLVHYSHRFRELGLSESFLRFFVRTWELLSVSIQTVWWRWLARREMHDAQLLAKTSGEWKSIRTLLDHFAARPASSFFLPHESPEETKAVLSKLYPEHLSALIEAADAACRNELTLLGWNFRFPEVIDWNQDPVTHWCWPRWHPSRIRNYLGSPIREADLIRFWELNRHQHFILLGIAYWLTKEDRYVDAFCSQIEGWIHDNPFPFGLNWYYGLEVSIRIMAWTAAFQFFRHSQKFREQSGNIFLKSLWQQTDFLSRHLQTTRGDVPNNHMIAELTALIMIGSVFPEFGSSAKWKDSALHLLAQQVVLQMHEDGVNKEQATGYHRFVAELLLVVVAWSRRSNLPCPLGMEKTLERMLDYTSFSITPTGTVPMWGDTDFGRALGLGQNKNFWDFRALLSAGAVLFNRADWKYVAGRFDEEAFWLLGPDALNTWKGLHESHPLEVSRAFPHSGVFIIRDAWTMDTDVAFFRAGPFGLGGEGHCAHAHCDLLSINLWIHGQPLLIDSGSYTYHGPLRDDFRLTAAHNTVRVDGHEQAKPKLYFNWTGVPEAKWKNWTGESVTGAFTCPGPVEISRTLSHPKPRAWKLIDTFDGSDEHLIEWFFHFAPDLDMFLNEKSNLTVLKGGQPFLTVDVPNNGIYLQLRDGWYSEQHGEKQSNRVLYGRWQGRLKGELMPFCWLFQRIG